ncbi:MAG: TonB family protein [Terricaulis sp.]
MIAFAALVLLATAASAQQNASGPPAPALAPEQQAEWSAAEANQTRISARPHWISGAFEYPDTERALGHHGAVVIRGLVGVDGKMHYATVQTSSRAPALDDNALAFANASVFEPAEDASGAAIAAIASLPVEYYSYTSNEGVGAAMYTCRQFVLDMDWWRSAFSDKTLADNRFFLMIRGLGTLARMGQGGALSVESNESFAHRWDQAIANCRAHPERRFAQAIQPEGAMIDRMQSNYQNHSH